MNDPNWSSKPPEVKLAINCAELFDMQEYNLREYFRDFTLVLLNGSEPNWQSCFETMPKAILKQDYLTYLKVEIELHDFEPFPEAHVFHNSTKERIEAVKAELKPKYFQLVNFAKKIIYDSQE